MMARIAESLRPSIGSIFAAFRGRKGVGYLASIIGANSVVTSDVPPNSIFAGVPAKQIGSKSDYISSSTADGSA